MRTPRNQKAWDQTEPCSAGSQASPGSGAVDGEELVRGIPAWAGRHEEEEGRGRMQT